MSGDTARDDDQDLSDDFILEDAPPTEPEQASAPPGSARPPAGPVDGSSADLTRLFDEEAGDAGGPGDPADATPGADDVLFVDHTKGLKPTVEFEGRRQFGEASGMQWKGNRMTPEEIGIPVEGGADPEAEAAEASFTSQLDALLEEDAFVVDGDQELQLVDNDADLDAATAAAAGEMFILDEGNGQWREPTAVAPTGTEDQDAGESAEFAAATTEPVESPVAAGAVEFTGEIDESSVEQAEPFGGVAAAEAAPTAGGSDGSPEAAAAEADDAWGPLPNAAEQFAEEVAGPVAEEGDAEVAGAPEPALVGAGVAATDGGDPAIYVDDQAMHVVGGQVTRRRPWLRAFSSLAAAALVLGAGAAVVLRPEWFGLRFDPDLVERVDVARPDVDVKVQPPAMPQPASDAAPTGQGGATDPNGALVPVEPPALDPGANDPGPGGAPPDAEIVAPPTSTPVETPVQPQPLDPTGSGAGEPTPPVGGNPATTPDTAPVVGDAGPDVLPPGPGEPTRTGGGTEPPTSPNVAVTTPVTGPESIPAPRPEPLLPAGRDLLIGEPVAVEGPAAHAPPGVVPGGKAFAQLHNGNFFVGAIKAVGRDAITMRFDGGEVTLAMADVSRVAPLDSSEFQALQESTSGFLRLSNRNRLVGTILKDLADDHYVLQMKSNRLMVPKDQIESVEGGAAGGVTVGGTKDDEVWLRELAARMLQESVGTVRKPD